MAENSDHDIVFSRKLPIFAQKMAEINYHNIDPPDSRAVVHSPDAGGHFRRPETDGPHLQRPQPLHTGLHQGCQQGGQMSL
jgi:hypothetical protein